MEPTVSKPPATVSKPPATVSKPPATVSNPPKKYYVDSPYNRRLDRVGKEIVRKRIKERIEPELLRVTDLPEILTILSQLDIRDYDRLAAVENVRYNLQRSQVEQTWEEGGIVPCTEHSRVSYNMQEIIRKDDIDLKAQIGKGGFGEVYAALWKGTPIAFKKLIHQQITNKNKKQLVKEIEIFSKLSHKNIVKCSEWLLKKTTLVLLWNIFQKLYSTLYLLKKLNLITSRKKF